MNRPIGVALHDARKGEVVHVRLTPATRDRVELWRIYFLAFGIAAYLGACCWAWQAWRDQEHAKNLLAEARHHCDCEKVLEDR